ncbi:S-layer homology domain-containing protein [Paenibacillus sp. IHB B 3415]|uniref:S-layer homology domain-containing protein n=1 Tax=Paenibacillus sp. IHB B 3415 TaxID=867080 RepID=UPI00069B098C|nr:S-layer homology domain-containing protein [Paenibacillus sp. IHB B 3415]
MLKKISKIGLALVLVIGLLPLMSLRAYAAMPSFTETKDFVIEPPATYNAGKNISTAQGLQDGSTAVLLNSFVYKGNTYVSSNFLRIFDSAGTLITDVDLSSLMDTYYKMTYVSMLALNNGNLLITYNKSDSNEHNLQLGTVKESTPNAYFMVLNKEGQKVTGQTKLNTFSDGSLPQLTRFVSATELSDGNIAFSWQRNDNKSTVTRVFTAAGSPVTSETLLVDANASMSYVSAGDGVYMVAYNSGPSNDNIYLKLFSNSGTLLKTIDVGARTNEKQLYLSTLNNGNFMLSQYYWVNDSSTVSLYDNEGNSQSGFTISGSLGEASAAIYKNGALPGFVTVSTDPTSNDAINDAYNYGTEWSGTQYAYLNYYDYEGNLVLTSDQPVDSAPVVFQGYDEDSWMFAVEYYPKFALYPAFGDKVVLIKTDNTDASHYRIIGKLFDTEALTPVMLLSAAADGVAGTTTSTKIDLTFDTAIAGLTADDITITNGAGSAVKGTLSGAGTDWSIGLTSVTTEGDVSVAVNSPSGYKISGSPMTVAVSLFTALPEATPAAVIDYAAEQLTGLTASGAYTINGTLPVTATADGKLDIDSSWLGTSLSIVKKGNGSTTIDSAVQTVNIPSRPAAPTNVTSTGETKINGNDGTLTNVTSAMEYKKGTAGEWTDVAGTTVTGLVPDAYFVRTKATATAFASEAQSVTVVAFVPTSEATPAADIDYAAEQLTGLTANGAYTINGTQAVTATANGKLALDSSWLGTSLSIVKKGNGSTTIDSAAQTVSIPSRPAAPTGVAATDETAIDAKNGTLTGVTTAMEYKKGTAGEWTDVAGTTVTALVPDTYYVRTKATATAFTSASVQLTVLSFTATPEATPAADIDYAAEQLTGLTPDASYTVNGTLVTAVADGNLAIDSSWLGTLLSIVKKGNGSTTIDSAAQTVSLPARPAAPVGVTVTDVTYNGANDGTLQNLTVQMEYKIGSTGLWSEVTDTIITGLAPDTYYVREKATSTAFASNIAQVTVHDSDAVIPAAPEVAADDQNNTIVGLDTSMEFSVDDGTFVRYDGTNLPNLSGEHTVKVRVAASGSVPAGPATTLIFTTDELIPAGGLSVSASDPSGAGNNGYTQISVTPEPAAGHKLLYKNFGTGSVVAPNAGEILTGYTLIGIDGLIPAANGDRIGIAEVDTDGKVVKYGSATAVVVTAEPVTPDPDPVSPGTGSNPGSGTSTGNAASNVTDVIVLVNGKEENAGKATTTTSGNLKITTIAVDPAKLQAKLDAEGNGAVVTLPMMLDSNIIVAELNGQMIKNMENVSATLVLQTTKGTYTLPASEINIGALAERLGNGVKLEDITLRITIGETPASMNQVVTAAAGRGGFTLVAPPIDFTVTATYGTSTVEVSRFNAYVERTVALPDGIDPNRITTGIVVDPDGTVRHVPTRLVRKDGRYYADIKSLTNSSYAVVWHPLTFADVDNHWAKNAVNDMGSRLVINGVNETTFNPNADITRAEFAAIIVRGLGLKLGEGTSAFADVAADSWYAAAVETASGYGLITGFEDGAFRPDARITREQAMNIIAKAMKLTGLADQTGTVDTASVLVAFTDAGSIGAWAEDSLALAAKAGLITGRGDSMLEAKANVTRAEVAMLIQRLLQKSDLID